jgi:hypothetical protein
MQLRAKDGQSTNQGSRVRISPGAPQTFIAINHLAIRSIATLLYLYKIGAENGKTYSAGIKEYRSTYWEPKYAVKETDNLACFKITPQAGVDREEARRWLPNRRRVLKRVRAGPRTCSHTDPAQTGLTAAPFLHRHRLGVST